jgi:hypothetical protein
MDAPIQPNQYAYDESAKDRQTRKVRRFYREAQKSLPNFTFRVNYNRGGIAVWGETYAKIYRDKACTEPVVEAYDTSMGILVRQWDGRNSGANNYVKTLEQFVIMVNALASKPFVRF